jgi:hypothetical protein
MSTMSLYEVQNSNRIRNNYNNTQPAKNDVNSTEFKEELTKAEFNVVEKNDVEKKQKSPLVTYDSIAKYEYSPNDTNSYTDVTVTAMKAKIELIIKEQQNAKANSNPMVETAQETGLKVSEVYDILNNPIVNANKDIKAPESEYVNPLEEKIEGKNVVSFKDDITGKDIYIKLTDENAEALKVKFGEVDNEKSKELVKSWYNEAAYQVGFLSSDTDKDGRVSMAEAKELNMMLVVKKDGTLDKSTNLNEMFNGDSKKIDNFLLQHGYVDDINTFINMSISDDKNLDGKLSFKEVAKEQSYDFIKITNQKEPTEVANDKGLQKIDMNINIISLKATNYYLVDEILANEE